MNPFRSRKKSHDGGSTPRSNTPEIPAVPAPQSRSRTFRRKKSQPEPKVELDISTVLPSTDNFRTSLLMPNLSARFSMLRDQDDPNTKIGKANDDSVLFPKRASRLNLFGGVDGLSDIAEVEPLSYTIRPPFATGRTASYASTDGYGTDDDASQTGSVMSRAKPGQGNKFFGGRQKIYKIPVSTSASAKDDNGGGDQESRRGMGKAVYDDDVAVSAWQALKEREREEKHTQEMYGQDQYSERESTDRRGSPPPSGYNRNRETSSSTTSGAFNARTSTAATSVASQSASSLYGSPYPGSNSPVTTASTKPSPLATSGLDRPLNKGKRMYGQGLDQQIYEQQSSAVNRLESLQQRRVHSPALHSKRLSQSRSATGLNDRFQRTGPLYASNNFRAGSPPPPVNTTGLGGFDLGLSAQKLAATGRDSPALFGRSPSLSPPISPTHESSTFAASVAPNDVGKATASGAFHKPRAQYNEAQYAQRMLQLHEGRDTPPPRAPSSPDAYSERSARMRNDSNASSQSLHTSKMAYAGSSMVEHVPAAVPSKAAKSRERPAAFDPNQHTNGTFLAGLSGDDSSHYDSSSERGQSPDLPTLQPATYQSLSKAAEEASKPSSPVRNNQHPAILVRDTWDEEDQAAGTRDTSEEPTNNPSSLGAGTGLSGLIKTHLRNTSGQSSIYPSSSLPEREDPPELPKTDYFSRQDDGQRHQAGIDDSKWIKRSNGPSPPSQNGEVSSAQTPLSVRAAQMREHAAQLRNGSAMAPGNSRFDQAQQKLGDEAPHHRQDSNVIPWQEQMKTQHARVGSTETQQERDDFEKELADRRRRVQEKLQNYAESGSRSASPMPGQNGRDDSPHRLPGLLKKVSKGSLAGNGETSSKAMKMLGISGPNGTGISPKSSNEVLVKDTGYEAYRDMNARSRIPLQTNGFGQSSRPTATPGPSFRDRSIGAERRNRFQPTRTSPPSTGAKSSLETTANSGDDDTMDPPPNYPNHPSNRAPVQSRSQLARKYSPTRGPIYPPADRILQQVQQPRSQSALSNRSRSNSKANVAGFFDQKLAVNTQQPAYQTSYPAAVGNIPRASPIAPYTAHATPPLRDISPISTAPTMVSGSGYNSTPRAASARKRSVNKHDISEPTFINSTSSVTTIDLPEGASLSNGMDSQGFSKPPIPPINPRRKQSPAVFGAPASRSEAYHQKFTSPERNGQNGLPRGFPNQISNTQSDPYKETSHFSADENNERPRGQNRLRKTSSEGRNLAARARHQALMNESPAVPSTPVSAVEGRAGMF
ncbi:hypothetical protein MMC30_008953 [Trapelia coarctata]|nr:hypothetical protein [Trapelia coarctata]